MCTKNDFTSFYKTIAVSFIIFFDISFFYNDTYYLKYSTFTIYFRNYEGTALLHYIMRFRRTFKYIVRTTGAFLLVEKSYTVKWKNKTPLYDQTRFFASSMTEERILLTWPRRLQVTLRSVTLSTSPILFLFLHHQSRFFHTLHFFKVPKFKKKI